MDADRQADQARQEQERFDLIKREMVRQQKLQSIVNAFRHYGLMPAPPSDDNPFIQLVRPPIIQPNKPEDIPMTHRKLMFKG